MREAAGLVSICKARRNAFPLQGMRKRHPTMAAKKQETDDTKREGVPSLQKTPPG
jgi:hypothetical protein